MSEAHVFPLRVYFEDTDAGGIVYYANYLKFAERARTEMLRDIGLESSTMMADEGIALAVRTCTADYRKPAVLDDGLEVHSRLLEIGGASLSMEQRVMRDGDELVNVQIRLACMGGIGKSARLPDGVRAKLEQLCAT
ncbi:MAG: tol-pal system-associated acyl-CoA thioesterase [Rhodospirillaceae bacterium]|nr:tol-pal system-associated acyl-CoA thioesterase [Rhodospirillaceae bacterium]